MARIISERKNLKMMNEFKTRFESDAAFRAKFADVKNEDKFMAHAKAEGYDLEMLSDDELDDVAGGGDAGQEIKKFFDWLGNEFAKIVGA